MPNEGPDEGPDEGQPFEVACDESGSEGEKLIGGETDVFAHASVRLSMESAAGCIQETRDKIGSPAQEYKSNHLLRTKHRPALRWLLAPSGPIYGNAHVHLTDKSLFIVGKIVDLVDGDSGDAITLYREGPFTFGRERWESFLDSFNNLMRVRNRRGGTISVDSFYRMVDDLRREATAGRPHEIMELLWRARHRVDAFRTRLLDDPAMGPSLDPFIPAIIQTVAYWTAGGAAVSIVHDEQTTLTEERIAQLKEMFDGRLADLTLVDSRWDARVQVADFLAGVARKIASDQLKRRSDPELVALLRPYVDSHSIWGEGATICTMRLP